MPKSPKQKLSPVNDDKFLIIARAEDEELAMQYYKVLRYYRVPARVESSGTIPYEPYSTIISVTEEYYEKAYKLITETMPGENFIDMIFKPIEEFNITEQENPTQAA